MVLGKLWPKRLILRILTLIPEESLCRTPKIVRKTERVPQTGLTRVVVIVHLSNRNHSSPVFFLVLGVLWFPREKVPGKIEEQPNLSVPYRTSGQLELSLLTVKCQ